MPNIAVMILAGGKAARMGGDKAFAEYEGAPLISNVLRQLHFEAVAVWVNVKDHEMAAQPLLRDYKTLVDARDYANLGPLSGVLTGLLEAQRLGLDGVVISPCDMPRLRSAMIKELLLEATIRPDKLIYYSGKRDYPLCSYWPLSLLPFLKDAVFRAREAGGLAVLKFIKSVPHYVIMTSDDDAFVNINVM